jgi:hypothetical protein
MTLRQSNGVEADGSVTLGLVAAAKLRVLPGRADRTLFHSVPERVRLASSGV